MIALFKKTSLEENLHTLKGEFNESSLEEIDI